MSPWARLFMGLPNGVTTFQDELQERILGGSLNGVHWDDEVRSMFRVFGSRQDLPLAVEEYSSIRVGDREYFAGPGNTVGLKIVYQLKALRAGVSDIPRQRQIEIATAIQAGQKEQFEAANEAEKHALEMELDLLIEFIQGSVSEVDYLEQTLRTLTWDI
jgi:hypothetical protein